jgi:hypothetical protein
MVSHSGMEWLRPAPGLRAIRAPRAACQVGAVVSSDLEVLTRYADAFRELVNARVWQKDGECPTKALRLNSPDDWSFICVAMDVIGDAALALKNFLAFSLDGPTRYEDAGERYLRLYGLLSAAYLQQVAVHKLYKLMNCPDPSDVKAEIDDLEIGTLRHQVASHSIDYRGPDGGKHQAFVPVRIGLSGFSCMVTKDRGGGPTRTIDLDEAVNAHCRLIASVLDRIYEKAVKTLFRGQITRIEEFDQKREDLRFLRDGNILVRADDPSNPVVIRVVFVDPQDPAPEVPLTEKRPRSKRSRPKQR